MTTDAATFRQMRRHGGASSPTGTSGDRRTPGEHDRDRILYTAALRRLAGVTQVVGPLEGHIFHNRLTHTHEVAQLARRLCQQLADDHPAEAEVLGLDADVAEAAALAHDLGHPPFGHIAEVRLNRLAQGDNEGCETVEGFEGNAQSFRIVTHQADHKPFHRGLDLTRATLNAILKYPWFHDQAPPDKPKKYGAYYSQREDFDFARDGYTTQAKSPEAAIMDIADAVAYSIHDLEDFVRAGLMPLHKLTSQEAVAAEIEEFIGSKKLPEELIRSHSDSILEIFDTIPFAGYYQATRASRAHQRAAGSVLITIFLKAVSIRPRADGLAGFEIEQREKEDVQMRFMQNLVWRHIISSSRLATQQHGQASIIDKLFTTYRDAIVFGRRALIPPAFQEEFDDLPDRGPSIPEVTRLAVDIVASFADDQAAFLHGRLTGLVSGSITDLVD